MQYELPLPYDCVVLAAGESKRMGLPSGKSKLLLQVNGRTIIEHAISIASVACRRVILVEGPVSFESVIRSCNSVVVVKNPRFKEGQLSSLQSGLKVRSTERVFVYLADLIRVQPETFRAVASQAEGAAAAYPVCDGKRGHPVLLGPEAIEMIMTLPRSESSARVIERLEPVIVEVDDPGIWMDLDTSEDYAAR